MTEMNASHDQVYQDALCSGTLHNENDQTHIQLEGEIDLSNLPQVAAWIEDYVTQHPDRVIIHLGLEYLDSAGIGWLFQFARRLHSHSQTLECQIDPGDPLQRLFKLVSFDRVAEIKIQPQAPLNSASKKEHLFKPAN